MSKWFFNERQRYIKQRVKEAGAISPRELCEVYDIGKATATRDIGHFKKNVLLQYDVTRKMYVTPLFYKLQAMQEHIEDSLNTPKDKE